MHWCHSVGVTILLLCQILYSHEEETQSPKCPFGFKLSYTKSKGDPLCYRLKGPEHFEEVYKDCVGNMYSSELHRDLNLAAPNDTWTNYRSNYPGGLFVDKSLTNRSDWPESSYKPSVNFNIFEDWCLVRKLDTYTAVRCSVKHYRYCIVKPYPHEDEWSSEGCEGFNGAVRFWSPISMCVTALNRVRGAFGTEVRATWTTVRELCTKRGSDLLSQGQIYVDAPILKGKILPIRNTNYTVPQVFPPCSEIEGCYGAIRSNSGVNGVLNEPRFFYVDSSYVFNDVACERALPLKNLTMVLTIDSDNKIRLTVNDTIDKDNILCYSDVNVLQYTEVKKRRKKNDTFILSGGKDGYYWCSHKDLMNFAPTESNKILYVRNPEVVKNTFALKFYFNETYDVSNYSKTFDIIWKTKIRDQIYDKYQKEQRYVHLLTDIKNKSSDVFTNIEIKRLYLDLQTLLVHVTLDPNYMGVVTPGSIEGGQLLSMKPVYYCVSFDEHPETPLGSFVSSSDCSIFKCVGDFMEGVTWVLIGTGDCTDVSTTAQAIVVAEKENVSMMTEINTRALSSESSEESTQLIPNITAPLPTETEFTTLEPTLVTVVTGRPPKPTSRPTTTAAPPVTTELPTTTQIPREEQLQQVLADLDRLVNNDLSVSVEDIEGVFDQVDGILDKQDDLEIPAQLLHLLDQLGSTVVLNETGLDKAVRRNIALLMADARPSNPVRGFQISPTENDQFQKKEPNSTILNNVESEVVVKLPMSVSAEQRRVSFVVFRNGRAFHSHGYAVNSRVLSVNIENVTHFHQGEVIDIHLNPMMTVLARNESRACAYWHFLENGTGYWSQEGCTFIRASEDGMLDTCRCDHLTHFAEVLVPRAVFSEANENALEIITIVGCFLSIVGLIMIGVTALLFRSWRREYSNKIWLQLSMAILILVLSFLIVIFVHFDDDVMCLLLGVLLHYAVLASFCWMLVAAVLAYRRLVLVFSRDTSHKLLKAAAFSWGAPCVVVGVLLSVSPHSYAGRFEEMTPSGSFCYPSGLSLWLTVYAPISAILLTNWILFALIVRSVFVSRRIQRHGENNEALRCASVSCMLVFLFGLPWIFGLFAYNVVAAYLFTLTGTFQGFILFVFFVVGNKKTRDLWLNKLRIKQTRKVPVTSSTYTNRSAEWRAVNAPTAPHEAKVSKPKVLASKDETRFS